MNVRRYVIDTNVLFAGLYSSWGASHRILRMIDVGDVIPLLSTTLLFEYEEVLRRNKGKLGLQVKDIDAILDGLCLRGESRRVHFLWRPRLSDPKDDHVLELAVAAGRAAIITHNMKDFANVENLGIRVMTPGTFIKEMK